jgi:hypothetical protein
MGNKDRIFPWPRYWFPAEGGDFDAFRQGGYLALPEEKYKPYYPSVPATLSELIPPEMRYLTSGQIASKNSGGRIHVSVRVIDLTHRLYSQP